MLRMTARRLLAALLGLLFFAMSMPAEACDLSCLFHVKQNRCGMAGNAAASDSPASNRDSNAMAGMTGPTGMTGMTGVMRCQYCGAAAGESPSVMAPALRLEQALADGTAPAPPSAGLACAGQMCGGAAVRALASGVANQSQLWELHRAVIPRSGFHALSTPIDGRARLTLPVVLSSAAPRLFVALRI